MRSRPASSRHDGAKPEKNSKVCQTLRESAVLLCRSRRDALGERQAFGFLAAYGAFLHVVFAFAVSHRVRNTHVPRAAAKLFRCVTPENAPPPQWM